MIVVCKNIAASIFLQKKLLKKGSIDLILNIHGKNNTPIEDDTFVILFPPDCCTRNPHRSHLFWEPLPNGHCVKSHHHPFKGNNTPMILSYTGKKDPDNQPPASGLECAAFFGMIKSMETFTP